MDIESFLARQANHFVRELIKEGMSTINPRINFPKKVQKWTLAVQNNRCNYCHRVLDVVNFDHIDGDRANNSFYNCQALCPNCHAKKTRRKV
jgi:hypothetical protein